MPTLSELGAAVITGGASGIGRAAAWALAEKGHPVAILDLDSTRAKEVSEALTGAGHRSGSFACDVSDDAQVAETTQRAVDELGEIEILVNCAGLHLTKYNLPFGQLTIGDIRDVFEVNVIGVVNATQACAKSMRRHGRGSIVNLSSISGYQTTSPYGVTKLAVRGLTIAFATELAGDNIRVNAIAPGLTATDTAIADLQADAVEELVQRRQLIHQLIQPDDIVGMIMFLQSDAARMITGETFKFSAGYPLSI